MSWRGRNPPRGGCATGTQPLGHTGTTVVPQGHNRCATVPPVSLSEPSLNPKGSLGSAKKRLPGSEVFASWSIKPWEDDPPVYVSTEVKRQRMQQLRELLRGSIKPMPKG